MVITALDETIGITPFQEITILQLLYQIDCQIALNPGKNFFFGGLDEPGGTFGKVFHQIAQLFPEKMGDDRVSVILYNINKY